MGFPFPQGLTPFLSGGQPFSGKLKPGPDCLSWMQGPEEW